MTLVIRQLTFVNALLTQAEIFFAGAACNSWPKIRHDKMVSCLNMFKYSYIFSGLAKWAFDQPQSDCAVLIHSSVILDASVKEKR
jgi:hypothetical protein